MFDHASAFSGSTPCCACLLDTRANGDVLLANINGDRRWALPLVKGAKWPSLALRRKGTAEMAYTVKLNF